MRGLRTLLLLLPLGLATESASQVPGPPPGASLPPAYAPSPTGAPSRAEVATAPAAYARLLARHVRRGSLDGAPVQLMDYAGVARDPDLANALHELAAARTDGMTADERLAFWINAYNLLAIRLVADAYPLRSIRDLDRPGEMALSRVAGTAAGRPVSLGEIETHMLKDVFRDPRILAALTATAVSCPDLRSEPYDGARIDAQLDEAMRAFLANPLRGVRRTRDGVDVSPLLRDSPRDMGRGGVAAYIREHAPRAVAAWLEGLDDHDLGTLPYDWSLNDAARTDVSRP